MKKLSQVKSSQVKSSIRFSLLLLLILGGLMYSCQQGTLPVVQPEEENPLEKDLGPSVVLGEKIYHPFSLSRVRVLLWNALPEAGRR